MNVQLTNYGIQVLNETSKPIQITRYVLGTEFGYIPDLNAEGIRGNSVYSNSPVGPAVINANVYQYTVLLDYPVGPFAFGEIALYDESDQCVAVAVSETLIQKMSTTNATSGNSIRLDIYLSMVSGSYNTWGEYIGSDITSQVPVVGSLDNLPPVQKSDPNFYIIAPFSSGMSAVLAYTAGNNGLWHFDCYSYANMRSFAVTGSTPTSITMDISSLTSDERQDLVAIGFGDKIIEFSSGSLYSICRAITRVVIQSTKAIIYFKTPLAIQPAVGDTFLFMSRSPLSVSQIVVATPDTPGVVRPDSSDFVVDDDGTLTLKDPVRTVNGVAPDEEGNILLEDKPTLLEGNIDLNTVVKTGKYWANQACTNSPSEVLPLQLEVVEYEGLVKQRLTSDLIYIRELNGEEWTDWELVFSTNSTIKCGTF